MRAAFLLRVGLGARNRPAGLSIGQPALPAQPAWPLGWDLLRHCFKPCIEFKKNDCCDCLAKYGFCGKHSQCREWVCKCLMKKDTNRCEEIFKNACGK